MTAPLISIRNLCVDYITDAGDVRACNNVSFDIAPGEVMTLMGVSGVGKSTVLNWLIGAPQPMFTVEGEAWLCDQRVDLLPTEQKRIGILFQDDLLFPHFSVGDNLAYALPAQTKGSKARQQAIKEGPDSAGLSDFYDRDPATLSGGQRARVSLLRALIAEPQALLMDEPFGALDIKTRLQMQDLLISIWEKFNPTILFVTHDIQEAVYLGDDIFIMKHAPSNFVKKIHVDLPFQRTRATKRLPRFDELVHEVEDAMMQIDTE